MSRPAFVHLHNHSNFSLLDGASRIDQLIARCAATKMRAIAITDHGNMFGALGFYRQARQQGLKPILGLEAYLAPRSRHDRGNVERAHEGSFHQLLLARDQTGYRNLVKLASIGYLEGFYYKPRIDKQALADHSEGLIGTTSCLSGEVPRHLLQGNPKRARQALGELVDILGQGNVYVELQDHGLPQQRPLNAELIQLGKQFDLPLVATNDCHYLRKEDADAHDILLCIQTGKGISDPNRLRFPNQEFYLKTPEEMHRLFAEIPEALATTEAIADRCNVALNLEESHLPQFPVPDGYTLNDYFEKIVHEGFDRRMQALCKGNDAPPVGGWKARHPLEEYESRLQHELSIISSMGFAGYFLIVWDFIRYAKECGIPVGPGRGSAAGSLVAYSLGITDVNPLEYKLVFERFLNPERISLPDIDIDFCMRRRGEVIEYVANKYGREKVAHIITFGTMAAKAAIRDVGRALEMPYGDVDRIARMIPNDLNATIDSAVKTVPSLQEAVRKDSRVADLVKLARQLEGQVRHASTHAAGVVIADEPLTDYVPLYKPPSGQSSSQEHSVATQYPMNDVEAIGLLKMDFLGLRTLTLVYDTLESISQAGDEPFTTADIPLDDERTFELFSQGSTSGIFQFESTGMRDALRKLKPSRIEDLIAMNALYRPGPIGSGMIDEYIRRKQDPSMVKYLLPELEEIERETYGVIVYQEQVMQIASQLAGFSLGEADVLRKAMGKKQPQVMASMEQKFIDGCKARKVPKKMAKQIWDQVVEFAGYGFNKAHSAAYALLAYQTAYLKANFPVHFMAGLLSSERDNTDKVVRYIAECREMEIPVLPPDVNESDVSFTAVGGSIRFGLAAIKGVGEGAVLAILRAREGAGTFSSLYQFCEQVDVSKGINRRTIESLIKAGALDSLSKGNGSIGSGGTGAERAWLMASLDRALESGQRQQRDREIGQSDLFAGLATPRTDEIGTGTGVTVEAWNERQVLAAEKEALGFYITGHPLQRYAKQLAEFASATTADLAQIDVAKDVTLGAIIIGVRDLKTRRGERMAVLQLEDLEGFAEAVVFPDVYRACFRLLREDEAVLLHGRSEPNEDSARMIASQIMPLASSLDGRASEGTRTVEISMALTGLPVNTPDQLRQLLERHRGEVPVSLRLQRPGPGGFHALVVPNRYLWVQPSPQLVADLEILLGEGCVRLRR
ncbi:MAG: DNA polymerase III subunit alpha [Acidobacteriota bacterium]